MKNNLPYANKKLGQHFLIDKNIILSITDDYKKDASSIIEVGPGPGVLTESLAQHKIPLWVIEKDNRFPDLLKEWVAKENIINTDALKFDFDDFITQNNLANVWLVSNLPYNISVPLFIKFLKVSKISMLTLMFQKEVGDKMWNQEKKNNLNSLMSMALTYFDVSLLCKVPPGAFTPPPKVDSVVLSFKRKKQPIIPFEQVDDFEKFCRQLFQFKRKQLGKVLKQYYPLDVIEKGLETVGHKISIRAEALLLSDIHSLFNYFKMSN